MAIVAGALATIAKRVRAALTTQPDARDLVDLALAAAVFAALAALIAANTGLLRSAPLAAPQLGLLALRALVIPAFGEELFFRAALVPARTETARPALWIGLSVALFTAWHMLETTFLPGSAATFLRADFLALAAALGLLCALLRWRSGSIWTAVALHWLAVVAWQGWFGGPALAGSA
jgi:predicted Abi (CAAX) family protease